MSEDMEISSRKDSNAAWIFIFAQENLNTDLILIPRHLFLDYHDRANSSPSPMLFAFSFWVTPERCEVSRCLPTVSTSLPVATMAQFDCGRWTLVFVDTHGLLVEVLSLQSRGIPALMRINTTYSLLLWVSG
jgi:hypothetical protein